MGISNTGVPKKGDIIHGEKGTYVLQDKLGSGGNGTVYGVKINEKKSDLLHENEEYVIKILTIANIKNADNRIERQKRFRREVSVVQGLDNRELDILPIVDSFLDVENSSCEWYIMPKAREYKIRGYSQSILKLKQMRVLGNTLRCLHQKGIYHRDIKPANLLFYKDRCCFTDFGLAWSVENNEHITTENEAVGPAGIRPPEMEYNIDRLRQKIDYQKVDVYLFAKTIWIALTGNYNGFRGEYHRNDLMIYLDKKRLGLGETIEPLHRMMEKATLYSNSERITLEECLELIDQQIAVAEKRIPKNVLASLLYDESMYEVRNQIASDASIFDTPQKMQVAVSKLEEFAEISVNDFGEKISLGVLRKAELIEENVFALTIKNKFAIGGMGRNRKLIVKIKQIIIRDDGSNEISIEKFSAPVNVKTIVHRIGELKSIVEAEIGIDGNYLLLMNRIAN